MSLKDKFKDLKTKIGDKLKKKGDKSDKKQSAKSGSTDSELSAEQVVKKEIFPSGKSKTKSPAELNSHLRSGSQTKCKSCACEGKCTDAAKKPASKRTRPTNPEYEMIDADHNSCDTSKS